MLPESSVSSLPFAFPREWSSRWVEGLPSPEAACLARGAPSVWRVGCLFGLMHMGGHDCGPGLLRSSPSTCSLRPEGAVMSSSRAADGGGVPLGTGGDSPGSQKEEPRRALL